MMVVAVEPACTGTGTSGLAGVGPDVGPLFEQGAVEPLDLAVGLWPVGPAVLVEDAVLGEDLVEEPTSVGEVVVGEHPFDDHASGSKPRLGSAPERRRGGPLSSARTSV